MYTQKLSPKQHRLFSRLNWVSRKFSLKFQVLCFCSLTSIQAFAWDGPTDNATWNQLKSQVEAKRQALIAKISEAEAAGVNTDYAYVTQVTIERFQTYAQYDRDNPNKILDAVNAVWWSNKIPANYHIELPFDELDASIDIADEAIAELNAQINGTIVKKDPVDFSAQKVTLNGEYYRQFGKPVFPSNFNFMPRDEDVMQAFGRQGGAFYSTKDLQQDGTVATNRINNISNNIANQNADSVGPISYFIGHTGSNSWQQANHPEALQYGRFFTQRDIDSPVVRSWYTDLFESVLPQVTPSSGNTETMHLLHNEPSFSTREGGWLAANGVSSFTRNKYRIWLREKYGESIANLNAVYGTSYFDFNNAAQSLTIPVPTALQGGPIWYDWCRFNMDRVNDWWTFLANGTTSNDIDNSPITVKVLGGQLKNPYRDNGLDMEFLVKLQDIPGQDFAMAPAELTDINIRPRDKEWMAHYQLDWVEQSMGLDFTKTVAPGKPFYDSEWHGLSARWQDFNMRPEYVRAGLWLAYTHGMSATTAWVWGRKNDGSFESVNSIFISEPTTQPRMMNAFGQTFKELNAHAESIVDLVPQTRDFYIYYVEDSAIQDPDYIHDLEAVYEALKVMNVRVGFTTPSEIGSLANSKTVIVPRTPYISDANLNALKSHGGNIVVIEPSSSFAKTEHGDNRGAANVNTFATFNLDSAFAMADTFKSGFASIIPSQLVPYTQTKANGQNGYGVLINQANTGNAGATTISMINISNEPRTVDFSLTGGANAFVDLTTGQVVSKTQTLQPYDVLLFETTSASASVQLGAQVEAESFTNQSGIQIVGGIKVGYIQHNDWTEYASTDIAGADQFTARVASNTSGGQIEVREGSENGQLLGTISVPNTGGWNQFQSFSTSITSPSAGADIYLVYKGGSGFLFDIDWFQFDSVSLANEDLGGTIEAEQFDSMSGVQVVNNAKVGYIENNDWIKFKNRRFAGASSITLNVASNTSGGTIEVRIGATTGPLLGSVTVPNTGGWNQFQDVTGSISGISVETDIVLSFKGGNGFLFDVNSFRID